MFSLMLADFSIYIYILGGHSSRFLAAFFTDYVLQYQGLYYTDNFFILH